MKHELLTSIEASEILGIHRRTLYRYVEKGLITFLPVGRKILIPREEVERFASSGWTPERHYAKEDIASVTKKVSDIKERLKNLTNPTPVSMLEVSKKTGIHYQTLHNIMRGKTKTVTPETLAKLEKYLGA